MSWYCYAQPEETAKKERKLALMELPDPTSMLLSVSSLTAVFLLKRGKKEKDEWGCYHLSEADQPAEAKDMIQ